MQWAPLPDIPGTVEVDQARGVWRLVTRGYARAAAHGAIHPVILIFVLAVSGGGLLGERGALPSLGLAAAVWAGLVAVLFIVSLASGWWVTRAGAVNNDHARVYVSVDTSGVATAALRVSLSDWRPRAMVTHHWGGSPGAGKALRCVVAPALYAYLCEHRAELATQTISRKLARRYAVELPGGHRRWGWYTYKP